ncbi:MAG: hypothetical protein ACI88A_000115 [Paraglaciecola sp.]|jgi:uncharacterized protein YqcC (DUF446 family)
MPRSVKEVQTQKLLQRLKSEMQCALLWSSNRPPEWAMSSSAPFACDRMSFEQWLQFIFIPKMDDLLINKHPLPTAVAIYPMAQQMLRGDSSNINDLMLTLKQLDKILSSPA